MDVFEQWETTTTAAMRSGSSIRARHGSNAGLASGGVGSPESSPNRIHAAARRRGRGSQGAADFSGQAMEYPTDIFSLRRIDISAALSAAAASAASVSSSPTTERLSSSAFLPPASFRSSSTTPSSIRNNHINRRGGGSSSSQATIDHAAMQNGVLILALSDATLIRWGLAGARDSEIIFLPTTSSSSSSSSIYKLFLDPTGSHLIISLTTAEHFYLHARGSIPKKLTTWQGVVVESIAFDRVYGSEASTRSILVGSRLGQLFETVLEWGGGGGGGGGSSSSSSGGGGGGGGGEGGKERPLVKVHELEESLPIQSLEFETLESPLLPPSLPQQQQPPQQQQQQQHQRHRLVLAATSGPVRLYKFMGGPTFTALFATRREEGNLSFQDFGGSPSFTSVELGLFRRGLGRAETLAMLTEGGVYHGRLAVSPLLSRSLDGLIVEAALNEYVGGDGRALSLGGRREGGRGSGGGRSPMLGAGGKGRRGSGEGEEGMEGRVISMVVTEFHFVLLFPKRLQVVSRLNGKQVQHFPLDESSYGRPLCLLHDAEQGTFWVSFTSSLAQVTVAAEQEDRHVWRLYLDKALLLPPSLSLPPSLDLTRRFDLAYKYCKTAAARAIVDAAQANFFFRLQQYELAARSYAKLSPSIGGGREEGAVAMTTESFEEIALKFVEIGEEGALRVYLLEKLANFGGGEGGERGGGGGGGGPYKTQRVMLCTWLMEIYLKRLAALGGGEGGQDGGGEEEEYERTVDEFRCFLRGHIQDLKIHPPTTYSLLGSHGRKREILLYATLIDDVERVVNFHVTEGEYGPALGVLEDADFDRVEALFYKHAHQLMESEPLKTLTVWMSKPGLNPVKLLPALAKRIASSSSSSSSSSAAAAASSLSSFPSFSGKGGGTGRKGGSMRDQQESDVRALAIRYLEYCVSPSVLASSSNHRPSLPHSLPPSSPVLYNYLLQLYADATDDEDEEGLLHFLRTHAPSGVGEGGREEGREGGRVAALDLRYALRVCAQHHKTRACVHLFSCLGLYEEAVALALRAGEVELAKDHAVNAGNEGEKEGGRDGGGEGGGLQKRLWVMVARHLIEVVKVSPKEAMRLLDESNSVLSIEDLLPYFSDITTIDAFKEKICESLSSYSQTIRGLKQEMEELALSTAEMEKAIAALRGRHLSLNTDQKCDLCHDLALTQHFYLFPCRHAFHAACLARFILPYLNPLQRRAVQALQEQLAAEISGRMTGRDEGRVSQRKAAQVEALQGEIDGYLAAECPWCGDVMIRTVDEPLVGEEEEAQMEARAWVID